MIVSQKVEQRTSKLITVPTRLRSIVLYWRACKQKLVTVRLSTLKKYKKSKYFVIYELWGDVYKLETFWKQVSYILFCEQNELFRAHVETVVKYFILLRVLL